MKKYLIVVSILVCILTVGYYLYYFDGSLYIPKVYSEETINYTFQVRNQELVRKTKGGEHPFIVKGVTIDSGIAGYHQNDFAIGEKRYLSWMKSISDMGANTIRVKTIMDVDFYVALDKHNRQSDKPLYLLQGVRVDDVRDNTAIDAYHPQYRGRLLEDVKDAVDVIHGRRKVWNTDLGSHYYRKDVSKWVLGFIVGDQWNGSTVAYTNHQVKQTSYKGEYISTGQTATTFEAMLAEVLDEMVVYETKKYGWQHLVSFASSTLTDPFIYRKPFAAQASKYAQLNVENLLVSDRLRTGVFASYQLLDYHPKALDYLGENPSLSIEDVTKIKKENYPENYVGLLTHYHQVPVLISGYGYSTSRVITALNQGGIEGPLTETQQGEMLIRDFRAFLKTGAVGGIIESWQDDWGARTWNTAFTTDRHSRFQWGDAQSNNQGFGLMAFENRVKNHSLDGSLEEWKKQAITENNGNKLLVDGDESYLYLAIQKTAVKTDGANRWLIPIDITPKTGSMEWKDERVHFLGRADFLLAIDGESNSRLLVQERYDAVRANYLKQTSGSDPFVDIPNKDSSHFTTASLVLKHNRIFEDLEKAEREDKWNPLYETGRLRSGNSQRGAKEFDSQADIYFGEKVIEIRIPWQLLNFSNPSQGRIHDDYYQHYGVSEIAIDSIQLGLGEWKKGEYIRMENYRLEKWNRPTVEGVLKTSYTMLKDYWKEEEK
ncbi:hypothetical protein [Streptococcus suis]|uniref:hypothetical protein n=1 Tax=Streptococcus suis TaxID=1307 RepID=UPI0004002FAE|nr:hypothetical protein [Streptococcus suis]HEM3180323.1 hypothetical protein [Streptococcus suis 92-4172]